MLLLATASCQSPENTPAEGRHFRSVDTAISSRGVSVPVTFVEPVMDETKTFPLVVMAHGHGGTRHENGSFKAMAERLAANGIASVRMDFPGCGDSTEPFANNNLSNMTADLLAARDFALAQSNIDSEKVGLFGWSMGGRLVLLLGPRNDEFKVIATWSPAATNNANSMVSFLGGRSNYDRLRALATQDGAVAFTTQWGQKQLLGLQWFQDLERTRPLDAIGEFTGPLFVLYGDRDDVIVPAVSESVIKAAIKSGDVVRHVVKGADHGLGIFDGEDALTEDAISATVRFLSESLRH